MQTIRHQRILSRATDARRIDHGYADRQRFLRGRPSGLGDTVNGYLIAACLGAVVVLVLLGERYVG